MRTLHYGELPATCDYCGASMVTEDHHSWKRWRYDEWHLQYICPACQEESDGQPE